MKPVEIPNIIFQGLKTTFPFKDLGLIKSLEPRLASYELVEFPLQQCSVGYSSLEDPVTGKTNTLAIWPTDCVNSGLNLIVILPIAQIIAGERSGGKRRGFVQTGFLYKVLPLETPRMVILGFLIGRAAQLCCSPEYSPEYD